MVVVSGIVAYRGRAPEYWDKLIQLPALSCGYGYANDEATVRGLLREMLGVKRLPPGTQVWPKISGEPLKAGQLLQPPRRR